MKRALYLAAAGLLGIIAGLIGAALLPEPANAGSSWSGCYLGATGSYNSAIVADTLGAEGPGIAGTVGCDVQRDRLVLGASAEYGFTQFEWANIDVDADGWAIAGRFGVLADPKALIYGKVGWTELSADIASLASVDLSGPELGGGVELDLGSGFYGRLEYDYLMLDVDGLDIDANVHSFRVGGLYKFSWSPDEIIPATEKEWKAPAPAVPAKPLK